jgi:hypothetical protein
VLARGIASCEGGNVRTGSRWKTANRDAFFIKQAIEPWRVSTSLHYLFGAKTVNQDNNHLLLMTQTQGIGQTLQRKQPRCEHVANVP